MSTAGPSITASVPAAILQEIVEAARADAPNETVGLLVGDRYAAEGGRPTRYVRMRNAAASPYRYLLDPDEQLRVMLEIDDADEMVWAIVHSHVASPAVPSATDVGLAYYPDSLYLICSLRGETPEVRAWTIRDGEISEVPLGVE
jgi:[CysO sulfur-carrier protein]-S-L-cysteine hydrolase